MEFRLLGRLELLDDHGRSLPLRGRRTRTLLALLLLHANRPVSVEQAAQVLWEQPPPRPREHLSAFADQIRRRLPAPGPGRPARLEARRASYLLHAAPEELDTVAFRRLVQAGQADRGRGDLAGAWEHLGQALSLWRGPALEEFRAAPFAQAEAARLEELRLVAMEERAQAGLGLGHDEELIAQLGPLIAADPLREPAYALLMLALYRLGRRDDALAAYQDARQALARHAGREPGPDLQRLERLVLARDPILDPPPATLPAEPGDHAPQGTPDGAVADPEQVQDRRHGGDAAAALADPEPPQVVTVLLCAFSRPAAGSPHLPPSHVQHEQVDAAEACIRRYGGEVLAAAGGRLLAVFGAGRQDPDTPDPDAAERAVRAALDISAAPGGQAAGIGVASGEVTITRATPDGRVNIAGDVLHAVLALAAAAAPGTVAAGAGTARATRRHIAYQPIQPAPATVGQHAAAPPGAPTLEQLLGVHAWAARQAHARTGATRWQGPAGPLVERDRELAVLTRALERCLHEREPQWLTLAGAPGLGRSRLVAELAHLADQAPALVAWRVGRAMPGGADPYGPLAEIVRAHAGLLATDPLGVTEAKLAQALPATLRDQPDTEQVLQQLLALVRPQDPPPDPTSSAPGAWVAFLAAAAAERPLVAVIEDLHHANVRLLDLLRQLPDQVGTVPLLMVCTTLPELLDRWRGWGGSRPNGATMTLAALSPAGAGQLLTTLLGKRPLPEATRREVLAAAGGNPLFLHQYARLLRERPGQPTGAHRPPGTLEEVLAARLGALTEGDRQVLADAAVVGEVGWAGAVAAVGLSTGRRVRGFVPEGGRSIDRDQVHASLHRLQRRQLLWLVRASSVAGETEYVFDHPQVRAAAQRLLPPTLRAERHGRAATWLAGLNPDPSDRLESIAHHATQAVTLAADPARVRLDEHTRVLLRHSGDRAVAAGALRAAAARYRAALALWPPAAPDHPEVAFCAGRLLVYAEHRGQQELTRARAAFAAAGDTERAAAADGELAQLALLRGDHATARAHIDRVLAVAPRLVPSCMPGGTASALAAHPLDLLLDDRPQAALTAATTLRELALERGAPDADALALSVIGGARLHQGDLGGQQDLARAVQTLTDRRHPAAALVRARWGMWLWWLGELGPCAAVVAEGRRTVPMSATLTAAAFDTLRAGIDCAAGRWTRAAAGVEALLARTAHEEHGHLLPLAHTILGRIRLGRGEVEGALDAAHKALAAAAGSPGWRDRHAGMALHARAMLAAGRRATAASQVDILLREATANPAAACITPDLALALHDLGRGVEALPERLPPSGWHTAARALIGGDPDRAAHLYDQLGSAADAACARLRAARHHLTTGQPATARQILAPALTFWQSAGATGHLRTAATLTARL